MKIACLTFTQSGQRIASRIQEEFPGQITVFTKHNYKEYLQQIFQEYDGIVFVSSTGIAVRLSIPFLQDKTRDPAIVVVDDLGRYAISLLSGHLGGANELAEMIAAILNCQPVITTASDGRGIEAVDLFAKRNRLIIENMVDAKILTAMMVDGKPVSVMSEIPVTLRYGSLVEHDPAGILYVTSQEHVDCDVPSCILRPKNLNVGIGCMRGKSQQEILRAITQVFQTHNLSLHSIKSLATIEIKQDEAGILAACKSLGSVLNVYTREEIQRIQHQFTASSFVQSKIGVAAVCEPCACLAGGRLIVEKTAIHGVTVAVAKEDVSWQNCMLSGSVPEEKNI